jgi:hypothetical protein
MAKFENYSLNKDEKLSLLSLLHKVYSINFGKEAVED